MSIYQHFARVYDIFMADTPYEQWAGYIDEIFHRYGVLQNGLILDLACGTGTMAFLMSKKGYDVIGVDASEDMLSEAYQKKLSLDGPLFLNQDMRALDLYGTIDAAYSCCDGMNYLLTEEDFLLVLRNVALFLNPGGIFIFDLKMDKRYQNLGDGTYYDDTEDASYIWKNHYDPVSCTNEYRVEFFLNNGDSFTETHKQRAYKMECVKELAKTAGFQMLAVTKAYSDNPASEDNGRVTFVLIR